MSILYKSLLRPVLFRMDPESVHRVTLRTCAAAGRSTFLKRLVRSRLHTFDPRLAQTVAGIHFENPIGLAAGFDKNGTACQVLGLLGFGHIEIGSISAHPSQGNSRPRLFRIPSDEGIVVHYGVPNDGAQAIAGRVRQTGCPVPLGLSLVKTNDPRRPPTDEEVLGDYAAAFEKLQGLGSYVNLNLSCPNSANDRNYFDDLRNVQALLQRLASKNPQVPVFLKLKPTLDGAWLNELVAVADGFPFVAGFGINLPAGKPAELVLTTPRASLASLPGSVSGRPVESLINMHLKRLYEATGPVRRYKLIAAGGVFSARDAYRKIRLGASLVQLYTAMVYRGPGVVKEIVHGLSLLLERDGFSNVSDAVGADVTNARRG